MDLRQTKNEVLKETLYHGVDESGLKVYILPKKGYSKSYAIFATQYGSVDSNFVVPGEENVTEVPDGIAHFLEHKLFEEKDGNVFDKFSRLGASANAFTSFNTTAYLFSCTSEFYKSLDILLDFVQNPYFTDESVQKEQGIIGQEIRMYDDDPNWRVFFNYLGALYHQYPVKKDIAGTIESIANIDKDILYKCYNTFYNPANMVLFVVGEVDPEIVKEHVEKHIKSKTPLLEDIKRIYPEEPPTIYKKQIEQTLSVSIPLFQMGFKDTDVGYGGVKLLKKDIVTRIILEMIMGRSSALYQRLYEQGLINDTFDADYNAEVNYGFTIFGGESADPEKVREQITAKIERLHQEGLSKPAFDRIKKVILGKFLRQFNSVEKIANNFIANIFRDINLFDYIEVYHSTSFEDVQKRFTNHFKIDNMALSVIRPHKQ
ncbi:pitrilysin family protein [Petroclostridium sp. X23]|uniref:EF-P 5-aminopentanol modification-associated protein YfmH n=1 Tax=Petroclostridium sp. X23 TaxID=3045146 RepID=UPI0024AE74B5|nr:pitrilysin family protein [Petroclostridium sp. X23]WHH58881.1 pitrilysin family protein [Petroclostridium sp. X23]